MKFESTALGTIEVNPETTLTFPNGIIGLEECKNFSLFHEEKDNPIVFWLQSLDQPDVTFSVIDPNVLGVRYEITLDEAETQLLQMNDSDEVIVMMIVRRANEILDDDADENKVKANAIAPLVINTRTRLGLQKCTVVAELVFRNKKPGE